MIVVWWLSAFAADLSHQGRLLDAGGNPVSGAHTVSVQLYAAGGSAIGAPIALSNVSFQDGYFSVALTGVSDEHAADAATLGLAIDGGAELSPRQALFDVPNAAAVGGQTLADLDARYATVPGPGVGVIHWQGASQESLSVNGSKCAPRTVTVSRAGNYLIQGRWNVITDGSGACRYVNCYLQVDGSANLGIQGDTNDGMMSVYAGQSGTYQSGSNVGVVSLGVGNHNLQWMCQKDDCGGLGVQCHRFQVLVSGPFGGL
jgi:hypothetical protein